MQYINAKSGVVITVKSEVNGGDWVKVDPTPTAKTEKLETPKKETKTKKVK